MLLSAVTQSAEDKKDNEISLHKSALDTKQKRFASYYEQLKLWNENYDHLLSEIEYALDRPVFGQADRKNEDFRIYRAKIREIDCLNYSFSEELEKLHLNGHSLKLRFAVIHNCFMIINNALNKQMNEAISKTLPSFDEPTESQIADNSTRSWRCQTNFAATHTSASTITTRKKSGRSSAPPTFGDGSTMPRRQRR